MRAKAIVAIIEQYKNVSNQNAMYLKLNTSYLSNIFQLKKKAYSLLVYFITNDAASQYL